MDKMFAYSKNLKYLDISHFEWNGSKVCHIFSFFYNTVLTLKINRDFYNKLVDKYVSWTFIFAK